MCASHTPNYGLNKSCIRAPGSSITGWNFCECYDSSFGRYGREVGTETQHGARFHLLPTFWWWHVQCFVLYFECGPLQVPLFCSFFSCLFVASQKNAIMQEGCIFPPQRCGMCLFPSLTVVVGAVASLMNGFAVTIMQGGLLPHVTLVYAPAVRGCFGVVDGKNTAMSCCKREHSRTKTSPPTPEHKNCMYRIWLDH